MCAPWSPCVVHEWFALGTQYQFSVNVRCPPPQRTLVSEWTKHWSVHIEKMQKTQATSPWFTNMKNPSTWHAKFSKCLCKKPTNSSSGWMVCEPYADGAVHVHNPIHMYTHLEILKRFFFCLTQNSITAWSFFS